MSGNPAHRRDATKLDTHRVDDRAVVLAAENGAAGKKGVGAGVGDAANVLHLDAAITLKPYIAAAGIDQLAGALGLAQRRLDEALAAETRIDAHDQHQVYLIYQVLEHLERCRRVERQSGLAARRPDDLQRAIDVAGAFRM